MDAATLASWNRARTEEELESFVSRREALIASLSE